MRVRDRDRDRTRSLKCAGLSALEVKAVGQQLQTPLSLETSHMARSLLLCCLLLGFLSCVSAYEVPVSDRDYSRQICSGMWGGKSTYINGAVTLGYIVRRVYSQ